GNSIEYVVAAFGALKAGAVLNPVNPALGADELGYILTHAQPRVIVTDTANAAHILSPRLRLPPGCTLAASGGPQAGMADLGGAMTGCADEPPAIAIHADDSSTLLYTSGTTGNPKGVLFTHGRTGTSGPLFIEALRLTPEDTILAVTPLFHGN